MLRLGNLSSQKWCGYDTYARPDTFVLDCQPSPKRLGMTVCQAQDSIGLVCLSDPSRLDLAANQVQDNYHPLIACLEK